jgi:hypothetical protein
MPVQIKVENRVVVNMNGICMACNISGFLQFSQNSYRLGLYKLKSLEIQKFKKSVPFGFSGTPTDEA